MTIYMYDDHLFHSSLEIWFVSKLFRGQHRLSTNNDNKLLSNTINGHLYWDKKKSYHPPKTGTKKKGLYS